MRVLERVTAEKQPFPGKAGLPRDPQAIGGVSAMLVAVPGRPVFKMASVRIGVPM